MLPLLFAYACSGAPEPAADAPVDHPGPAHGDTLVVGMPFDPGNFNALVAPYALSGYFIENIALGLASRIMTDKGMDFAPALAESWVWSEDGASLTYTLREGLTWDDGTPLTSADAAFTWSLITNPATTSNWFNDSTLIAGVETPDPRTVIFRFKQPGNKVLLQGVTHRGLVAEHKLKGVDPSTLRGHAYGRAPSASGPWRVASWQPEEKVVLEHNPSSTAWPKPYLDRVIARVLPEYATRLLELRSGSLDMLNNVELRDVPGLRQDPRLRIIRDPLDSMIYVGWNQGDPRLASQDMRKALTLGIDRDTLMKNHYSLDGELWAHPCTGSVGPDLGAWYNGEIQPLPYDPQGAKTLLAGLGYADANDDGVLDKDGQPLRIRLLIQAAIPETQRLAVEVQAMLAGIGVALEVEAAEPNRFSTLARQHEFEAILWSFGNNPRVDPFIQWHSQGQYNWMQYKDPETDRLLELVRNASTLEEAQRAAREVQARVYEAQPATFLFWEDSATVIDARFQDVATSPFNSLEHLELWWVPESKQKY